MEHTPTPWRMMKGKQPVYKRTIEGIATIGAPYKFHANEMSISEAQANAEFIVRAVNSHDELVEALKTMYGYFNDIVIHDDQKTSDFILECAREALAKAESK